MEEIFKSVNDLGFENMLYCIDGNSPRLDETDKDILKKFIQLFKVSHPTNIDYWKKIIIMVTKCNMIKPTTYNDKPLPTYDYISWCRKKYKISSKKALNRRVKYG